MHRVDHGPSACLVNGIASLVRAFVNLEPPAAILEHLRHEGQAVELAFLVKRFQDFFLAPDLDPITGV